MLNGEKNRGKSYSKRETEKGGGKCSLVILTVYYTAPDTGIVMEFFLSAGEGCSRKIRMLH
jgi:hypothetical protein